MFERNGDFWGVSGGIMGRMNPPVEVRFNVLAAVQAGLTRRLPSQGEENSGTKIPKSLVTVWEKFVSHLCLSI